MASFGRRSSQKDGPPSASDNRRRSSVRRPSIDPMKLTPMHKVHPATKIDSANKGPFKVLYIGAGNINFGSPEGPWNHSIRLEHKLGPRLRVVGIIDPAISRAKTVIAEKCASFVQVAYKDCKPYPSLKLFLAEAAKEDYPHAVIIGSPPAFHGSDQPGKDLELQLIDAFPGVALFVEKPISTDEVQHCQSLSKQLLDKHTVVSVGYMLRYLKVVQSMKSIIEDNELHVMATVARYICSYAKIAKPAWWDKSKDCGPIVEQGTHFCDLSRYFGGDIDLDTVQAHSLEHYEEAGQLSVIPVDEDAIPAEQRIPRVTSATWKYLTGAVGSLTHALILQGTEYSTELEVYADGYQLRLIDPYNNPQLVVRKPTQDATEKHTFADDDPYFSEISAFIDAAEGSNSSSALADEEAEILSSFEDAVKTYAFTWAIRFASEKSKKMSTLKAQ